MDTYISYKIAKACYNLQNNVQDIKIKVIRFIEMNVNGFGSNSINITFFSRVYVFDFQRHYIIFLVRENVGGK